MFCSVEREMCTEKESSDCALASPRVCVLTGFAAEDVRTRDRRDLGVGGRPRRRG